jgi:hypothetical protein
MKIKQKDVKKTFRKCGACSHTFFHILNREYEQPRVEHERASDPMAGGVMQNGYQCGMLWGAAMAAGAESYRRNEDKSRAVAISINTAKRIMDSFVERTGTTECIEITSADFTTKFGLFKYMVTGKFLGCFNLARDWAPEAIDAANAGFDSEVGEYPKDPKNCAMIVAERMGANEEEQHMVAGLAGGIGLSGYACGALVAAIWMKTLRIAKLGPKENTYMHPDAKTVMDKFYEESDYKILCSEICSREFDSLEEHSDYIDNGGCDKIIEKLVNA